MNTILERIIEHKRSRELPSRMRRVPLAELEARARSAPAARQLVGELRGRPGVALIAEVKRASPSRGLLRAVFDPVQLAAEYAANGAAALSVLTDTPFFQGELAHLTRIRAWLDAQGLRLPVLRKDFIVHPYQVYEARAAGADAILLIAAVLSDAELAVLRSLAERLGMDALIEVHDRAELERVLALRPRLVGVNNRDLRDFSVSLDTCLTLRPLVPAEVCFVAESGIHTPADVRRLAAAGVDAMLVGEALVTAPDVGARTRELAYACQG